MADVPDMDPRWPSLLVAARVWRASLIPKTSTSTQGAARSLLEAIEALDEPEPACEHPRAQRVFYPDSDRQVCGRCGADLSGQPGQ